VYCNSYGSGVTIFMEVIQMKNERGEVVTGIMVLMMAGMMIFGLFFMHGGHGDHRAGDGNQQVQHSDSDHRHMHDGSAADKDSVPVSDENK
jgi:hypothetical protein